MRPIQKDEEVMLRATNEILTDNANGYATFLIDLKAERLERIWKSQVEQFANGQAMDAFIAGIKLGIVECFSEIVTSVRDGHLTGEIIASANDKEVKFSVKS
ncbi:MAG: hypothetical protein E6R03_03510 [Hyphomicrobiaceae bacterium]|nr:MAG: hypothetical protein E6R03_03510 [Hyphomicrobiaceae bacterium]